MKKPSHTQRIIAYVSSRKTPATAEQIAAATKAPLMSTRARITELTRAGTLTALNITSKTGARKGYTAA